MPSGSRPFHRRIASHPFFGMISDQASFPPTYVNYLQLNTQINFSSLASLSLLFIVQRSQMEQNSQSVDTPSTPLSPITSVSQNHSQTFKSTTSSSQAPSSQTTKDDVNHQSALCNQEKSVMIDLDDDSMNMFESEFDKECDEDYALDTSNELERYFMERNEDRKNKDFEILSWWKINSSKFPVLAEMARDVLAVQVSTVASESAFSTGGRVLDAFRSSLSPAMVQALICSQNWIRSSSMPLDMSSVLEEHETYQIDSDSSGVSEVTDLE